MCDCRCYFVPPHILRSISDSTHNPQNVRNTARETLTLQAKVNTCRHDRSKLYSKDAKGRKDKVLERVSFGRIQKPRTPEVTPSVTTVDLLKHISESERVDYRVRERARKDLERMTDVNKGILNYFSKAADADELKPKPEETFYRAIYDAQNSNFEFMLPGSIARAEGEPPVKDKAVNDAYDNVGHVLQMFKDFFNWVSIDNENAQIISTVHFGTNYENAYWDPYKMQLVFGDGDEFLKNFTGTVDVIGHELTHAVTEAIAPLEYYGQSGALNEHISDVFGIIVKQRMERESAEKADWLIGEGCLVPGVKGVALRSMKAPGTAYDDPRFGKDPQPDHYKHYVDTFEDNGGVHIYSGIPNRAFYLAAIKFGGYSWQKAGKIWWDTLQSGVLASDSSFLEFAKATVAVAKKSIDAEAAAIVKRAWQEVGVLPSKKAEAEAAEAGWADWVMGSCRPS